jgi:hypothetical protein
MTISSRLAECMSIEGAIAVALVDCASGMAIATDGEPSSFDLTLAAAGSAAMLTTLESSTRESGLDDEVEDILITLKSQFHLIRPLTDATGKGLAVYLILSRAKGNLGIARYKLTRIEKELKV